MRQKRAKQYRKQMLVYNHTFKFREPYQIIVDDQIVELCAKQSFDLTKGLSRTIQAEVKPMITQCCMQELYKTKNQALIEMAKTFERRRCNHPPQAPLPPHECIKSIVIINGENKHRYVVATENEQLRWSLRKVPGIPLIYMNRSVMVMEPLSKASATISRNIEAKKLSGGLNDAKVGTPHAGKEAEDANKILKKRKGPKEPNPLSIKKKKETSETEQQNNQKTDDGQKKRRRRKHKKNSEDHEEGETNGEDKSAEPTSGAEQPNSEGDNEE